MTLQFDPRQPYQLDAIRAVVDTFAGQPVAPSPFEVRLGGDDLFGGNASGTGNALALPDDRLLANVQAVQQRNGIVQRREGGAPLLGPDGQPVPLATSLDGHHFSVEMETGTGKTYVFLRTLYELHRAYGWTKFVLVVPSVAIREGALQSLRALKPHFDELYGRTPLDHWAFSASRAGDLRGYAQATTPQLLVLNIDAFNKKKTNVIYDVRDQTGPRAPIEYLQDTRPVVILDEPQNMESKKSRDAIASLHPLCTLRYSATHRNPHNLLYRLTPVDAYDLGLVKRIEVDSVLETGDFNTPYVHLKSVRATKTQVSATLEIDVQAKGGPQRKTVTVKGSGADLRDLSGRDHYAGYTVAEINAGDGYLTFTNGVVVETGQTHGGQTDDLMRVQVRETVRRHFDKERRLAGRPPDQQIKVLSLFFIDRVANYAPDDGKLRLWFEEAYEDLRTHALYRDLNHPPVGEVHAGYFATTRAGDAKDTRGTSAADADAYELIMRDKARLLDPATPLKFIFSHSALREGWDNPNVFQICTLNESKSEVKKRQEIGRGLRLPVQANGERSHDERVNVLTVVANEAYDDFARALQTEIEAETGVSFQGRIKNARERTQGTLKKGWRLNDDFRGLWDRIKHKTRYRVDYSTADLIDKASTALAESPDVAAPTFTVERRALTLTDQGVGGTLSSTRSEAATAQAYPIPDLLAYLQRETDLTRHTLAAILRRSGRLADAAVNPQAFLDQAAHTIRRTLRREMIRGVKYELRDGEHYDMLAFQEDELEGYLAAAVDVDNSLADVLFIDSETERRFAQDLDARDDVRFFLKLPGWFMIPTPVGTYNPDWAIVLQGDRTVYFVAETKGSLDNDDLRQREKDKIACGRAHFGALSAAGHDVVYDVYTDAAQLREPA